MSAFPDWQKYAVKQRRPESGCIPTGYEMILRAVGAKDVDFDTFQDDFDLDQNLKLTRQPRNNFDSVAQAVKAKYPHINFQKVDYAKGEGQKKLKAVEDMISRKKPVLISLALAPLGGRGWHIMPVVDSTVEKLTLLWAVDDNGKPDVKFLKKSDFVLIHDTSPGGDDIAFLAD